MSTGYEAKQQILGAVEQARKESGMQESKPDNTLRFIALAMAGIGLWSVMTLVLLWVSTV